MLIKWRKNEFQKFLPGTIFKIKKRDQWRSDTILYVAKISYQSENWFGNCKGGPKFYTDTHTHAHTHRHTHTQIHTPDAHFISIFLKKETRLKRNKSVTKCIRNSVHLFEWPRIPTAPDPQLNDTISLPLSQMKPLPCTFCSSRRTQLLVSMGREIVGCRTWVSTVRGLGPSADVEPQRMDANLHESQGVPTLLASLCIFCAENRRIKRI